MQIYDDSGSNRDENISIYDFSLCISMQFLIILTLKNLSAKEKSLQTSYILYVMNHNNELSMGAFDRLQDNSPRDNSPADNSPKK